MVDVVSPHLGAVLLEWVERDDDTVMITGRSQGDPVPYPACATVTGKVHGYHQRRPADTPASRTPVVLEPRLRSLVRENDDCPRQRFHEQVPGLAERYARRTPPPAGLVAGFAVTMAGRTAATLLASVHRISIRGVGVSQLKRMAAAAPSTSPAWHSMIRSRCAIDSRPLREEKRRRSRRRNTGVDCSRTRGGRRWRWR
jgi:hypothetical protein